MRPRQLKILEVCPEHPKRDQNPKFTPLSETTSIPVCFIWQSPPRGSATSLIFFITILTQRTLDTHHVIIFYQSNSSLNMVMADTENFPEARIMAVIFGFPSFLFDELSWNPSSGLM